jgi:hypothetical protein
MDFEDSIIPNEDFLKICEDRNKAVASWFKTDPLDIKLEVTKSKGGVLSKLDPGEAGLGVFSGYSTMYDVVLIASPQSIAPIFKDNLGKQITVLLDFALIKKYLKEKYFPEQKDFKLYNKYISNVLSKIASGNFQDTIIKNNIKFSFGKRPFTKEQELEIVFLIMLEKSGLEYIFNHLDSIFEDKDIKKTCFTIYKKSFNELVGQYQNELLEYEKKMKLTVGRR